MKKKKLISKIQEVLVRWGEFAISDLDMVDTPVKSIIGRTSQLVERFNNQTVTVVTYINETEIDEEEIFYSDLNLELLEEILNIAEDYDTQEQKFFDSCRDENF
jgi:hypothetical protein